MLLGPSDPFAEGSALETATQGSSLRAEHADLRREYQAWIARHVRAMSAVFGNNDVVALHGESPRDAEIEIVVVTRASLLVEPINGLERPPWVQHGRARENE